MEEWHVSGSDSDGEGKDSEEGLLEIAGLRIQSVKMLEIFRAIEAQSLELDCLSNAKRKGRTRRKRLRQTSKDKPSSPANAKPVAADEVSETMSEIRSTTSTELCRDPKRPSLSRFDYCHEEFPGTSASTHRKRKRPPDHKKDKKLASLDGIVSDMKKLRKLEQSEHDSNPKAREDEAKRSCDSNSVIPGDPSHGDNYDLARTSGQSDLVLPMEVEGKREEDIKEVTPCVLNFDDDSEVESPTSETDMKLTLLSQINRVEQLLDAEGFS